MHYSLLFFALDLTQVREHIEHSEYYAHQALSQALEEKASIIGTVEHPLDEGYAFEHNICNIASSYFAEPNLFNYLVRRSDEILPLGDAELGFLTQEEIRHCIEHAEQQDITTLLPDDDTHFSVQLQELEQILQRAHELGCDLLCIYQ